MFTSVLNRGFQMQFSNGWTISVQWGAGNYCERRSLLESDDARHSPVWDSPNAEIAIWDSHKNYYSFGSDVVKAYCSTDEVAEWISKVSKFKEVTEEDNQDIQNRKQAISWWKDLSHEERVLYYNSNIEPVKSILYAYLQLNR